MSGTEYLEVEEVLEIQFDQIERYGAQHGLRDAGLVVSAVTRPRHKAHYEGAGLIDQAAALLFGLAKNYGFVDGNKRIAAVTLGAMRLNQRHEQKPRNVTQCRFSPPGDLCPN